MIKNNVRIIIIIAGFILLCVALCICVKQVNADDDVHMHIKNYSNQYISGGEWGVYESDSSGQIGDELYRFGNGNGEYSIPKYIFTSSRGLAVREIATPPSYTSLPDDFKWVNDNGDLVPAVWLGPGYNIPNNINITYGDTGDGTIINDGKLKIKKQTNVDTDKDFKFRIKLSKKNRTTIDYFNFRSMELPESGLNSCISFSPESEIMRPKLTYEPVTTNTYNHNLIVRWIGDTADSRPSSITVNVYRDDEFYDTVTISEENNWSHQMQLNRNYSYSFVETNLLSNYSVLINTNSSTDTTAITFNYNAHSSSSGGSTTPNSTSESMKIASTTDSGKKTTLSIDKQLKTDPYSDKNNTVKLQASSNSSNSNEQFRQCLLSNNGAIEYRDQHSEPIAGMGVKLYKIATLQGDPETHTAFSLTLDPNMRKYEEGSLRPIDGFSQAKLNNLINQVYGSREESVEAFNTIAAALAPYLKDSETPAVSDVTNADGLFSLENINPYGYTGAMYVLIADGAQIEEVTGDAYRYRYKPIIISTWDLNVGINPALNNGAIRNTENVVPNSIETTSRGTSITYTWDEYFNPTPLPEGWTKIQDGIYEFTLKKDQEIDLNLPVGTQYEIEEIELPTDWELESKENDVGYIQSTSETSGEGTNVTALFKNKTEPKYSLTVTKNVTGNLGNKEKQFTFTIDIFKESFGNRTNQGIEAFSTNSSTGGSTSSAAWYFNDSTFTFVGAVSTQEKIDIIKAIPKGEATSYRRTVGSTNQLSTLYETGITGYRTNDGRKFDFLITDVIDNQVSLYAYLYEVNKDSLNLDDNQGISKLNNTYTFTLRDGESITIPNIPAGYQYKIIENDYSGEGYLTYVDGSSIEGRSIDGTLNSNKSHTFENRLDTTVPTNVPKGINYTLLGLLLATAISIYCLYSRKKHINI